jgi:hypothetical protein
MKIRACIVFDIPDPKDRGAAIEQVEATLENAINNDDLTLYVDENDEAVEVRDYKLIVEEVSA